jgi:xylulokinase
MTLLIGIDLGTTGCKAAVFDETGRVLGESYLEYGLITLSATMVEQDPLAWWDLTLRAINLALEAAAADRGAVRGIAVSSQGISFVLLDEADRPLGNAINWLDGRATAECDAILAHYRAETLFALTGKRAAPFYILPKLLWIRRYEPEKWQAARRLLMGHDYLVYRLCGAHVTDHSLAGGTLLYDLAGLDWSGELLDAFAIPRGLLPDVHWAGEPAGKLRPEVADALGLRRDVIVSVGGQDQKCAALGAGIDDRTATVSLGTASAIEQLMASPATDPAMRIPAFTFLQSGRWVLEGVVGTAAVSMRWLRDMLGADGYAGLDAAAVAVPCGSDGVRFYPHLSGASSPHWNVDARGSFHGLSLATSRGHLVRAVMEGVAFQVRENLEVTQTLAGRAERVIAFGGGTRSALWRAVLGDVLDRPLAWAEAVETAGLGGAMLAGAGCGLFPSVEEAQRRMLPPLAVRPPDPSAAAAYDVAYGAYRRLENTLLTASA